MADTVGQIGASAGTASVRAAAPQPRAAASEQTGAAQTAAASATTTAQQPISPSFRQDPVTGVLVTQYLNETGEIESQIPSEASLAYLRVGLTANGEAPPKTDAVVA